jgi:hypothetical protein
MGTPNFSPTNINCGVVSPGQATTTSTTCGVLSAMANVTAAISDDTSGGALWPWIGSPNNQPNLQIVQSFEAVEAGLTTL